MVQAGKKHKVKLRSFATSSQMSSGRMIQVIRIQWLARILPWQEE